jgi:hypothetical protein
MPVQININYDNNFNPQQRQAVEQAKATWQNTLDSQITVQVEAYWGVNLGGNLTAVCVPNGAIGSQGGQNNTWYTSALADKLANQNNHPNTADMAIFFDHNFNWNATTNNPANNQYDLESVALHELCHGFGFLGLFWVDHNGQGSYGNQALINTIRQLVHLPFYLPNLNNHPSIFGRHIVDGNQHFLTDTNRYPNNSLQLGTALQNNLFFPLNGGQQLVPIYAPNPFEPFSSAEHLDPGTFPNSLMRPSIGVGQVTRQVDVTVRDILTALGW